MHARPRDRSAVAVAADLRERRLRARDHAEELLAHIKDREATVRAWAHLDPTLVRSQADVLDDQSVIGALHGLPIGVKDIIDTADLPTEFGSPVHAGRRPDVDAAIVRTLRDAGAIVMGKTVTTEFALFHPGPTTNPHDPTRTPGGSSSGSAAAVAAGMVPFALATQTAGSIVRPAAFCGIAGWKPTFGTLPLDGVLIVAPSLDTMGALAADVADLQFFAAAVAGIHDRPTTPRLGFAPTAVWERLPTATRTTIAVLADQMSLPTVMLPSAFDGLIQAQQTVMAAEAHQHLAAERDRGAISASLASLLDSGGRVSADQLAAARALAAECRLDLPAVLADAGVDALLTPAVLGEAPVGLAATGDPLCCRAWTLLGVPCVAVPGLTGPAGLPLGVQVVAAPGADAEALAAAGIVQAAARELTTTGRP